MKYKLFIKYNGKNYHGWQIQLEQVTVCGKIQAVLNKIFPHENPKLVGSSRTDTGVHALRHNAHFSVIESKLTEQDIVRAMNANLPKDIRVTGCVKVADDFHARFYSKGKTYKYFISNSINPMGDEIGYYRRKLPNINVLRNISEIFIGEHDFSGFSITKSIPDNPRCLIYESQWTKTLEGILVYTISGNRFLHQMIRMIVGAQLGFESGILLREDIQRFLETGKRCPPPGDYSGSKNCRSQIKVAPASGLLLVNSFY